MVSDDGDTELDTVRHINMAKFAFGALSKIWKYRYLSIEGKPRLFSASVLSVLLFMRSTCKVTSIATQKLQDTAKTCMRQIIGVRCSDIISNSELGWHTRLSTVVTVIG